MTWIWHMCMTNMRKRGIRTILTVLGVVIGVISIVSLLAIGLGVKDMLLTEAESYGSSTEIMVYGTEGKRKELMLTDRRLQDIAKLEFVEAVYPELNLNGRYTYGKYEGFMPITGVPEEYLDQMTLLYGEIPEETMWKPELVVGSHAMDYCYNPNTGVTYLETYQSRNESQGLKKDTIPDYSGDSIDMQLGYDDSAVTQRLNIVGVSESASYHIYCNIDTLKKFLKRYSDNGVVLGQPLDMNGEPYSEWIYEDAIVTADDIGHVDALVKKLQDMGFQAESNKEYVDMVQRTTKMIQILLGGIGAIALIVAVIGIGNTMTTAVYDRVHDIGVLKVLGCDPEELLFMFLMESGILGGVGGVIGVAVSYLITEVGVNILAVKLLKMTEGTRLAEIPWWLAVSAVGFAILLGVIAGYFPARWAAGLKPIKAVQRI